MSGRGIHILDEHIANKIAAGEVIERPASVVKELVENALDAGAKRIEVEIRQGGKEYIRVTDDGAGMAPDQVPLAFERHATSKIRSADDLFNVHTLGFRGEALPSIAAVAEVELKTRTADATGGVRYTVEAGRAGTVEPIGTPVGTTIVVRRLFFNTPARYKFLRTEAAERRRVADVAARVALAWPAVAFRLLVDGRQVFATPGDGDLKGAILAVYGKAAGTDLVPVDGELDGLRVHGFVGRPDVVHGNRDRMSVFLNGRWIQSAALFRAIEQGYETLLPPRRYPLAVIHLTVDPASVDVNVHPAKAEVRFKDDRAVFRAVLRAVRGGLTGANLVGTVHGTRLVGDERTSSHPHGVRPSEGYRHFAEAAPPVQHSRTTGDLFGSIRDSKLGWQNDAMREHASAYDASTHTQSAEINPTSAAADTAHTAFQPAGARPSFPPTDESHEDRAHATNDPTVTAAGHTARTNGSDATDADARRTLQEMTVLGQLHRTFILGETKDGLWIVDQHVAHERVLYEQFLERGADGKGAVQQLLMPVTVTLPPDRVGLVEQFHDDLARLGFVLEPFGGTSYLVRGVPVELGGASDTARLTAIVEELLEACEREGGWNPHDVAASLACRAAIKAGQPLDQGQMRNLLAQLAEADNPFACPHGRPIVVELGRLDLERRFGRR